jgi:hypothetical protein
MYSSYSDGSHLAVRVASIAHALSRVASSAREVLHCYYAKDGAWHMCEDVGLDKIHTLCPYTVSGVSLMRAHIPDGKHTRFERWLHTLSVLRDSGGDYCEQLSSALASAKKKHRAAMYEFQLSHPQ